MRHFGLKLLQIHFLGEELEMCGGRGGNRSTRCSPKLLRIRNAHKTQGSASLQPPVLQKQKGQQIVAFLIVPDLFNFDFFSSIIRLMKASAALQCRQISLLLFLQISATKPH